MLRLAPRTAVALGTLAAALAIGGCGRRAESRDPAGPTSQIEADAYVRRAIRSSNEGVILFPSQRAERVFELPRLNEIAHALKAPAAKCFLMRAIETMEPVASGERGYEGIPEGQLKIRVRIAPSGEVVRTEVLETGFLDEEMEPCIREVLEQQRWPPNKSGNTHFIDAIYWVSLGMQQRLDQEPMATHVRREQVGAGRRAKACLQGRVDAGRYEIRGLNLIDREGSTMVNRIDTGDLPPAIRACLATAFRAIRLPREPDTFVRPLAPRVVFEIDRGGTVSVEGERWLELVELEERARRAAERAALVAEDPEAADELPARRPIEAVAPGLVDRDAKLVEPVEPTEPTEPVELVEPVELGSPTEPDEPDEPTEPPPPEAEDPGKGGLRLELGGRRRGDDA